MKSIFITGGAGFIGSHLVRRMVRNYPEYNIVNLDKLTYAGNLHNLLDVESSPNYSFERVDICDAEAIETLFEKYEPSGVIHLAAESHVDRSILEPLSFVQTNVLGTGVLLNTARKYWKGRQDVLFYHVSTDEVYGSLGEHGLFTETTPYDPRSPYSASKASSDHLVRAYGHTFGLPYKLSNCSNNYGPYQFPEKLIPLMILNARDGKPLPVYGKGDNIRDWLWVDDHCEAIDLVYHKGRVGETYNIGGMNEWKNLDLVHLLCKLVDEELERPAGSSEKLIAFVTDRAGHDQRYAIDCRKLTTELGWRPSLQFEEGLRKTVKWYLSQEHQPWVENVRSGAYQHYYEQQYSTR
jgi:dTDP-glucose 4,6-dehydratase